MYKMGYYSYLLENWHSEYH